MMKNASARQAGLTLVELMVGLAIGLFIVAAGTVMLTGHLRESRLLLMEARLMQDLRTATDLLVRDARRAGYWADASRGVWQGSASVQANPYAGISPSPSASAADAVSFRFSRDATENHTVDANEEFGFRLRRGAIEMLLGRGNWQAVTDPAVLRITAFTVTPQVQEVVLQSLCEQACPDTHAGGAACPPRLQVRSLSLHITGHAAADASVRRSLRSSVRLRNDAITGSCPPP
jgi:prepilin peptidase dependent protein B